MEARPSGAVSHRHNMAIALDNSNTWHTGSSVSSITWNHTITASSNVRLFVAALSTNNDLSCTYNGVSMSKITFIQNPANSRYLTLFELDAPATGSNAVLLSGTGSETVLQGGSVSYSGCSLAGTGTLDASTTNTQNNPTAYATSLTTIANNCWCFIVGSASGGTVTGISAGANTTQRQNSGFTMTGDTNAAVTPAGSTSMTLTVAGGNTSTYADSIMVSFAPFIPTAGSANFLPFFKA